MCSQKNDSQSWTDDLPVCKNTGIGFSINQKYREDGHPQEAHCYEDYTSNYKFENCHWYAVFDGHEGRKAAEYCSQRMLADICFSPWNEKRSDEEIKEFLRQCFVTVEKAYLDTMGEILAEKTDLICDIPEGCTPFEFYRRKPEKLERLKYLNNELECGTTAAVALICNDKLFVANVGNCRVLLFQTDQNNVLKVVQLSVDHDLKNEDELLRLSQIGVNINKLRKGSHLGNQESTRCLGNYSVKLAYTECDELSTATQEPVTSEPDIHGGILLDESCRFLLLMSSGLYKSIEEATRTDQVNKFIAQCVVEQFREQSTLAGVAQAVVDKVVHMHRDWFMSSTANAVYTKREDMTLVLRNFNYPLPNAITSPSKSYNPIVMSNEVYKNTLTANSTITNTTSSSEENLIDDGIGADLKIAPYVDFSEFYNNFKIAKDSGTLPQGIEWE
ncbi:unnamed protein product [Brassicogethes aeneus]|uniref:PPM-type phosphatase domain-containing protein n=1 Tax=Brassicogethes aeneus TaxID=1431903 RepID=A0A9P0FGQ7_BRAAE|nr:unnamed protein product [Brassicogethes aeneus]